MPDVIRPNISLGTDDVHGLKPATPVNAQPIHNPNSLIAFKEQMTPLKRAEKDLSESMPHGLGAKSLLSFPKDTLLGQQPHV